MTAAQLLTNILNWIEIMSDKKDQNTNIMIEFIAVLLQRGIVPADFKSPDSVMIPVPFPRKAFESMSQVLDAKQIEEALSDLMFVTFFNAILDCIEKHTDEIRQKTLQQLVGQAIQESTSMN